MGFVLEFDAKNNILCATLEGRVTDAILLDSYAAAARYATSHPPCRGLWDCSGVTESEVSGDTIRQVAEKPPIIPTGYMRVIVASQDYLFGMMRMFQILSETSRPDLHVVRTMDEADRLLIADSLELKPVS
jgi:hypothetical protein